MKSVQLSVVLGALTFCYGGTAAASASLNQFTPKVMPVLVQVNSHGRVTDASPAMALTPKLGRLLRASLDELISAPATDKRGRPISSQFILNLALNTSALADGNYEAKFAYVSAAPVPPGSWYWVHIDGHRIALASQRTANPRHNNIPYRYNRNLPAYQPSYGRPAMPVINSSTPSPAAMPRQDQ